ncbi:hypothetical protein MUB24_13985 [Lederbergia sp. NSJ-179]|uniref:hypothetical protein n=1 Tax=Lederbergia sp. NSJ-179 TaxID=2931402 RepID=UPI001FD29CE1|nr:hypothetical protein [Lederbergia sp. NSJ-179]MCJ7841990.1 hypothetical protein [Lederbergia sp. NSJ-179]
MKGFIYYQFKSYIRSLKWIPPVIIYMIWVFIFYTYQGVPILSSYAVTSIALLLIMTWITIGIFSLEKESEKQLLFVQLSSKLRYLYGKWIVCLLFTILLLLFAIFYPVFIHAFIGPVKFVHYGFTFHSHFYSALAGIFVGTLFSATFLAGKKYSWLGAILVNVISITSEGIIAKITILKWPLFLFPPIGLLMSYLNEGDAIIIEKGIIFTVIWEIVYMIIGFIIVARLFMKKES